MELIFENQSKLDWVIPALNYKIQIALNILKANDIEIPNGKCKAVINHLLKAEFYFEDVPNTFQNQFQNALENCRLL
jgi:hypothetical protein